MESDFFHFEESFLPERGFVIRLVRGLSVRPSHHSD